MCFQCVLELKSDNLPAWCASIKRSPWRAPAKGCCFSARQNTVIMLWGQGCKVACCKPHFFVSQPIIHSCFLRLSRQWKNWKEHSYFSGMTKNTFHIITAHPLYWAFIDNIKWGSAAYCAKWRLAALFSQGRKLPSWGWVIYDQGAQTWKGHIPLQQLHWMGKTLLIFSTIPVSAQAGSTGCLCANRGGSISSSLENRSHQMPFSFMNPCLFFIKYLLVWHLLSLYSLPSKS